MLNKIKILMIVLVLIVGMVVFGGFSEFFGAVVTAMIPLLATIAWYNNTSSRRRESIVEKSESENIHDDGDEEYHNDFSRVPAGSADPVQPPPRSIGYGYGDGGKSVMEDLERIGIKTTKDKKEDL